MALILAVALGMNLMSNAGLAAGEGEVVQGTVRTVSAGGTIVLDDGNTFRLWGLRIVDLVRAQAFLIGKNLSCTTVVTQKVPSEFDCVVGDVYPERHPDPDKSLFVALQQVGIAEKACLASEAGAEILKREIWISFICAYDGHPVRRHLTSGHLY